MATLTKAQIRSRILLQLKGQKEEDQNRKSKIIAQKLFRTLIFKKAKIIMMFISFGGEVKTKEMINEARRLGKIVAVPVCSKNGSMRPSVWDDKSGLKRGLYEIYEPAIKKFINLEKLDLVVVPGVAFDKTGNRLGRGKGYYDRFLHRVSQKTVSIGLAYDFQILPSIPITPNDKNVNKVIFA